jgi:UDP-galactopyranose mutase
MRRLARDRQVFFVEEPRVTKGEQFTLVRNVEPNLHVVSLRVPADLSARALENAQRRCVSSLTPKGEHPLLWIYSPAASRAARDLAPSLVVYDCVADHAAREGASAEVKEAERSLLASADLVITAGTSLFEAKRALNVSTYPLPSSIDAAHFAHAKRQNDRDRAGDLSGLREIPGPRVGFLGSIDDRVDLDLVDRLAEERPGVHIVLCGALSGVTKWSLPDRSNVHFLGAQDYDDLPDHVASWDAAIFPFRGDVATRRSEPSGLLACIAAGKTIVSTPLDELAPYVAQDLLAVAEPSNFAAAVDVALRQSRNPIILNGRRRAREQLLTRTSWDRTCHAMFRLVDEAAMARKVRGNSWDQCGRQTASEGSRPPFAAVSGARGPRIYAN